MGRLLTLLQDLQLIVNSPASVVPRISNLTFCVIEFYEVFFGRLYDTFSKRWDEFAPCQSSMVISILLLAFMINIFLFQIYIPELSVTGSKRCCLPSTNIFSLMQRGRCYVLKNKRRSSTFRIYDRFVSSINPIF